MKKLGIFYILFFSTIISANFHELEYAIEKSDAIKVAELLSTTKLTQRQITSYSTMAQNMLKRRHFYEKFFLRPTIALGIPGAALSLTTIPAICLLSATSIILLLQQKLSDEILVATGGTILTSLFGLPLLYGCCKLFRATHGWHNDAIEIQQLIDQQEPEIIQS